MLPQRARPQLNSDCLYRDDRLCQHDNCSSYTGHADSVLQLSELAGSATRNHDAASNVTVVGTWMVGMCVSERLQLSTVKGRYLILTRQTLLLGKKNNNKRARWRSWTVL